MATPDLNFQVESAEALPHAASPQLAFKLRINDARGAAPVHTVALRCQIRIEPGRRRYSKPEQDLLPDLFGPPERWGQTLRPMLWTHVGLIVPPFEQTTLVDLPVPCSFDFTIAATKYFYALEEGEIPLIFLFNGTVFYRDDQGALQAGQISWEKESVFRLPVRIWREMMDIYYPNSAWLGLRRDVFDRLYQFKSQQSLPTWEQAIESLLKSVEQEAQP
jgi:hypothetical protein